MADRKHPDQARWDAKYGSPERTAAVEPAEFLKKNLSLLPKGVALDIAAGEGRNAVFLAESGFTVDAVDMEWRPGSRQLYLKKPLGEREELVPEMRASSDVEADDVDEN